MFTKSQLERFVGIFNDAADKAFLTANQGAIRHEALSVVKACHKLLSNIEYEVEKGEIVDYEEEIKSIIRLWKLDLDDPKGRNQIQKFFFSDINRILMNPEVIVDPALPVFDL